MAQRLTKPGKSLARNPKKTPMSRERFDWDAIRRDYVEGIQVEGSDDPLELRWLSIEQVANKNGVAPTTAYARSGQEHWPALRRSYILKIEVKRRRARLKKMAEEGLTHDKNVLTISKLGLSVVMRRLGELVRSANMREQIGALMQESIQNGELPDLNMMDNLAEFDAREMESLANAATRFEELGRKVLGDVDMDNANDVEEEDDDTLTLTGQMQTSGPERMAEVLGHMRKLGILDGSMAAYAEEDTDDEDNEDEDDSEQEDDINTGIDINAVIDAVEENGPSEADVAMTAGAVITSLQQRRKPVRDDLTAPERQPTANDPGRNEVDDTWDGS